MKFQGKGRLVCLPCRAIRPRRAAVRRTGTGLRGEETGAARQRRDGLPREGVGGRHKARAGASHQRNRAGARNAPHLWRAGVRGEAPAPYPEPAINARATASACRRRRAGSPLWGFLLWGVPRRGESRGGNLRRGAALRGGFPVRGRKVRSKPRARASPQRNAAGAAREAPERTGVSEACRRRAGARSFPIGLYRGCTIRCGIWLK
jgi:hypothetical protein